MSDSEAMVLTTSNVGWRQKFWCNVGPSAADSWPLAVSAILLWSCKQSCCDLAPQSVTDVSNILYVCIFAEEQCDTTMFAVESLLNSLESGHCVW
ncbi:hypothetical protein NPIL_387831 [Nephila pilipes]|uniref:Uncharacterized protein n=1 Tax=Nephila pilipes TaxID=299642 RepID=A0A8X6U8S1_NEPPI|nr:hypothetical protein NPIL_387831 [Nephila pilipes]